MKVTIKLEYADPKKPVVGTIELDRDRRHGCKMARNGLSLRR